MTGESLSGKSILFFGPETFNYEKEIVSGLESNGASVIFRSDKPGGSFFLKVLLRLFPRLLWGYADRILGRWLSANGPAHCDVVLVIKGEGLSPKFLDLLKSKYPDATLILYLWDSVKNVRNVESKLSRFDCLFSFDKGDCLEYPAFKYRPLFFLERYLASIPTAGSGCFFIGTMNGDRPAVISRLVHSLPKDIKFDYWLFVRSNIELFVRRIFDSALKGLDPSRLLRKPMSAQVVSQHFSESAAVVDIEHPNQLGLTMRTFEVLASGKKLITTNKSIASHDFYDASRICIVSRNKPQIDTAFIESPAAPLPDSFYRKYSLQGWLAEIMACEILANSVTSK
jgi:hypothetical protein